MLILGACRRVRPFDSERRSQQVTHVPRDWNGIIIRGDNNAAVAAYQFGSNKHVISGHSVGTYQYDRSIVGLGDLVKFAGKQKFTLAGIDVDTLA